MTDKHTQDIEECAPYLRFIYLWRQAEHTITKCMRVQVLDAHATWRKECEAKKLAAHVVFIIEQSYHDKYSERLTCARYLKSKYEVQFCWLFKANLERCLQNDKTIDAYDYLTKVLSDEQLRFINEELNELKGNIDLTINYGIKNIYCQSFFICDENNYRSKPHAEFLL